MSTPPPQGVDTAPTGPVRGWRAAVKRSLDIVAATLVLGLLSPVFAAIAAYVAVRDGRPVIFRQVRVGRDGRPFTIFKFRTMVPDAERRREQMAAENERRGPLFKVSDDPRITRSGRILRRSSADELPQFVNVLRGDMSVVGPRPALPSEVEHFPPELRVRELVPPGITGLWQVDGRTDADFGKYTELDRRYVEQWSLRLDLSIVLRTPFVIIRHAFGRPVEPADGERGSTNPAAASPDGGRGESHVVAASSPPPPHQPARWRRRAGRDSAAARYRPGAGIPGVR